MISCICTKLKASLMIFWLGQHIVLQTSCPVSINKVLLRQEKFPENCIKFIIEFCQGAMSRL
ncbi:hypothetical protein GLYMA_08G171666v4 [Glycine max]|nr:hypothetical protein GLYMA_08G171666v4 [Glycine max]KAH1051674.1 hypothetical protein GYH30_021529 [Glycine max]